MNKGSPQAKGLVSWIPTHDLRHDYCYDRITGEKSPTRPLGWAYDPVMGWGYVHSSWAVVELELPVVTSLSHITVSAWGSFTDVGAVECRFCYTGGDYILLRRNGTAAQGILRINGGLRQVQATGIIAVDTPYLLTQTYDGADHKLYVNGVQKTSTPQTPPLGTSDSSFRVGWSPTTGTMFTGDVRIYNFALSAAGVLDLYQNPWELYEPTRISWAGFDSLNAQSSTPAYLCGSDYYASIITIPSLARHRTSKPPTGSFRLNEDSEQAEGLVSWWPTLRDAGQPTIRNMANLGGSERKDSIWYSSEPGVPTVEIDQEMGRTLLFGSTPANPEYHIADNDILSLPTPPWTFTLWMRSDNSSQNADFLKAWAYGTSGWGISIFGGRWNPLCFTSPGDFYIGPSPAVVGKWYQLTWVDDGVNSQVVYLNGKYDSSPGASTYVDYSGPFEINANNAFLGALGDMRVYNRALSAKEAFDQWNPPTRWELYKPIRPIFLGYSTEDEEPPYVWPFSDNFTGSDDDPWDVDKWTTSEG